MVTVVTGASGYIGSHVVAYLLARGERVRAAVRDVTASDMDNDGNMDIVAAIYQSLIHL